MAWVTGVLMDTILGPYGKELDSAAKWEGKKGGRDREMEEEKSGTGEMGN